MHIFDHGNAFFLIYQLALFFLYLEFSTHMLIISKIYSLQRYYSLLRACLFFSLFLVIGWLYSLLAPSE